MANLHLIRGFCEQKKITIRELASRIDKEEFTNKKSNVGTISYMPAVFGCACASVVIRGLINEL